jgi:CrcB protein
MNMAMCLQTGAGAALAVGFGAALGALLRWRLGAWLNPLTEAVPAGTLAANLIGGYLVGLVLAWLAQHTELSPAWRLFLVTGFLGGLTTFSPFSAEVMALLQQGRLAWAGAACAAHLCGSLLATWAGIATVEIWRRAN